MPPQPGAARFLIAWSVFRGIAALAIAYALVHQFAHDLSYVRVADEPFASHVGTFAGNFFSYFTNESNIFAALYLAAACTWGLTHARRGSVQPRALAAFQVLAACCMLLTGVVYNVLLRGDDTSGGVAPFVEWTNELMHVAAPLVLLADVLISPRARRIPWRVAFVPLGYAIVYVAYTLLRAPFITSPVGGAPVWYPYPFFNPAIQGGWAGVFVYIGTMAAGFAVFSVLLVAYIRWRARPR
ncbi:MAG TPA: Pr6Pr family membrane protein [Candidatus Microbacterium stercoravium]|uniref:Pr6Pr family membrane protein n=1 Tax=Candidatus Microbacterium stercoravium TaxID=2838697 RepID=A0A9D2H484_9MICO|nr:Pr6Pr family membrane protein [Candidatus Microbacterium stercoravium]